MLVQHDGGDHLIAWAAARVEDLALGRSGEYVPVAGALVSGTASVNQAAIMGARLPMNKQRGHMVFAGTLTDLGALEIHHSNARQATTVGLIRRVIA